MSKEDNATPVSEGYKAIEVSSGAVITKDELTPPIEEVTLEEVTEGEPSGGDGGVEVDLETGEVTTTNEDDPDREMGAAPIKEEGKPVKYPKKKVPPKQKATVKDDKRPSRAKKRIKQLHTDKQALQVELDQVRQEKADLEAQYNLGSQEAKEILKSSLENNMVSMQKSMKEAMENGDSEEAVRLSVETTNAQMQLAGLTSELANIEKVKAQPKQEPIQQTIEDVPEKALDWIDEHPQFKSDTLFHVSALTISNQLIDEGFDDQSDDFYAELDKRLSPRFPEVFGTDEENGVEYNQDDINASNEAEDGNEQASQEHDEKGTQTVSGSSRTPPHKKGSKGRGSKSVVLSPQMVRQAERWGLSLEQVARRVAHNEKNTRDDGYVALDIKKS